MRNKKQRFSEFLLREQDEGGDEPKGGAYTAPKERILQYPDVADSLIETNASLDEIVDRYLLEYEKEAVPINREEPILNPSAPKAPKPIGESKKKNFLLNFLFEQDEAADPNATPADTGDSGGGGGGDTPEPGAAAPVTPVPQINIREFAEGVARLTNNYQSLLDPKSVILTRAMFYISKNYSPRLAKEMMGILERDFDLTPKTKSQQQAEVPPAPRQANAGPDSGSGVPSGGGK